MSPIEVLVRVWAVLGTNYTVHSVGPNEYDARFGVSVTEGLDTDPAPGTDGTEMTVRARRVFCVFGETLHQAVTRALHRTVKFIKDNEEWTNEGPRAEKIDALLMELIPSEETRH